MRKEVRAVYPIVLTLVLAVGLVGAPTQSQSQQRQQHGKLFPPENLPELEGPDRDVWQRPDQIMDALNIAEGSVVAELGAGSGWFTIRLAERVGPNGKVYAEDIQPQMIEVIKRRVRRENFSDRIVTMLGSEEDPFVQPVLPLDAVLINDAYHEMESPVAMLRNAAKALKPEGRIGIVEFTKTGGGPGPEMDQRVDPERVIREANEAGLQLIGRPNMLRYQYILVFAKASAQTGPRRDSRHP